MANIRKIGIAIGDRVRVREEVHDCEACMAHSRRSASGHVGRITGKSVQLDMILAGFPDDHIYRVTYDEPWHDGLTNVLAQYLAANELEVL